MPRCHTSQLTVAYTGLNAAMGGVRGMTLILTNHSGSTCYVYGYPGLAFFNSGGSMATHLTWMKASHATVILRPGGNAQAMLTWRVNVGTATPFNPSFAHITPPDEYTYLWTLWQGGPVLGGDIVAWPLRAAPAGPFPAGPAASRTRSTACAWPWPLTAPRWWRGNAARVPPPSSGPAITTARCGLTASAWTPPV